MGKRGPQPSVVRRKRAWTQPDIDAALEMDRAGILTDDQIAAVLHRSEMDVVMKLYALTSGPVATKRVAVRPAPPELPDEEPKRVRGSTDALPPGHPISCSALGIQPWWSGAYG